jgi:hypothetical protein
MAFTPVNESICMLRLKTRFFNLSIINIHAPTEDKVGGGRTSFTIC